MVGRKQNDKASQQIAEWNAVAHELNLASGWYVACGSKHVKKKVPTTLALFGQEFIAWRKANGSPTVTSAHCPHMGASLAKGSIADGVIKCPFHHWRFDGNGTCVGTSTRSYSPARARLHSLATEERNGYVWVWFGSGRPSYPLPRMPLPDLGESSWGIYRLADFTNTTVRRILENAYDPDHLVALHGLTVNGDAQAENMTDADAISEFGEVRLPEARFCVRLHWPAYNGLLGAVSNMLGMNGKEFELLVEGWPTCQYFIYRLDGKVQYRLILATTPIGRNYTIQHIAVSTNKSGRTIVDLLNYTAHRIEVMAAAKQDVPIFNTIRPDDYHGIYTRSDRALRNLRKFYQSWVAV
jgi:rieske (2Fe-2S) protein